MDDVADRMQEILKEFQDEYSDKVIKNIAHYAIFNVQRDLNLGRKPTLEEFEKVFTKEMETKAIHECAFRAMCDLDVLESSWSGGYNITNLLEQAKRKIIIKIFTSFQLEDYLKNKLEEILAKGETK